MLHVVFRAANSHRQHLAQHWDCLSFCYIQQTARAHIWHASCLHRRRRQPKTGPNQIFWGCTCSLLSHLRSIHICFKSHQQPQSRLSQEVLFSRSIEPLLLLLQRPLVLPSQAGDTCSKACAAQGQSLKGQNIVPHLQPAQPQWQHPAQHHLHWQPVPCAFCWAWLHR